jgi:hypothetical protein
MSNPFPNPPVDVAILIQPSTPEAVRQVLIDSLVTLKIRADLWPTQGSFYAVLTVVANVISAGINERTLATKGGWLGTALGGWLTWLALYMYGVLRTAATFATGTLTLTNALGGTFSFAPFTATFQNSTTKATFTNTEAISLGPGPNTSQTFGIQATAVGSASNSAPGTIDTLVTTMLGVTCSNAGPVLGIDEQDDVSLQLECWNAIAANSAYGPRQSFGYAVQTAVNSVTGSPVNINRYRLTVGLVGGPGTAHTGNLTVTLASPAGPADANDVTGVAARIEAIARPECVNVVTQSATIVNDTRILTVYVSATPGLLASTVQAAIENALAQFFKTYPIGGRVGPSLFRGLFLSALEGVCYSAWPGVFEVTSSTGDLAMTTSQVAVDEISVVVVLVQP